MATIRSIGGSGRESGAESFEQSFQALQEVVRKLSEGNLTLQEALAAFEEGMSLADRCGTMLEEAELRVKQVSERAMRTGNAAAREAAISPLSALDLNLDADEPELLGFEIETYESVVFDAGRRTPDESSRSAHRRTTGPEPEKGGPLSRAGNKEGGPGKAKPPTSRPHGILDPLFDEDD